MGRGLYETGAVTILNGWKRRTYRRELDGAARFLGILKVLYFLAAVGIGVWLWFVHNRLSPPDLVYGFCLLGIFVHGFLATTSRPVLWATLAAAAQTLYVLRVFLAGDVPYLGLFWMALLWAGVGAARQVERILVTFPELRTEARRQPWRTFWFVVLTVGIGFLFLSLVSFFSGWWSS
jgi:hypothetical protein